MAPNMRTRHQDKASSVEPDAQQTQKPTGRKRRASNASEVSEQAAPQDPTPQTKRRKKTTKAQSSQAVETQPSQQQLERLEEEEHTESGSRHVHFSPAVEIDGDGTSATTVTPHPRKHSVNRRITLSPADLRNGVKLSTKGKTRASMPASASSLLSPGNQAEIDFVPLRDLINQRIEQRLKERQSLLQIDGSDEIEIPEEEDMMVYKSHTEAITYPKLSTPDFKALVPSPGISDQSALSEAQTTATVLKEKIDAERVSFEKAIKRLSKELSEAKAANEIMSIELQSLGFGGRETSPEMVLASIRESFDQVRDRLTLAFPGDVPDNISNTDLVELVIARVLTLKEQTKVQDQALEDKDQLQQELIHEINGLVDRLTEAEIIKTRLENANKEFDSQEVEDDRYIKQMENKLKEIEKSHAKVHAAFNQKESQLKTLRQEHEDLDTSFNKLTKALDDYRKSEKNLHDLITRMEEDHNAALIKADDQRKEVVEQLTVAINKESAHRRTAEADADDKQTFITELETRYEKSQSLVDELKNQLASLEVSKESERIAKETAESDRDEKSDFINQLETKIEQAETDLEELNSELDKLRGLNEAERRQREAAETELDDSLAKIKDLDTKLRKTGVEANELRQKIWGHQENEKKLAKDLEDAISREEQLQDSVAAELERREDADALAADRAISITDLQEQLRDLETQLQETLAERDEKVAELAAKNDDLQSDLSQAKVDIDNAANDYEDLRKSNETRITKLEKTIRIHTSDLTTYQERNKVLEQDAIDAAQTNAALISERDEQITTLNDTNYTLLQQLAMLEKDKVSLERRVEDEAEAMLELQASKDDDIAALKDAIRAKQTEIDDLGKKAVGVDNAWNALMKERDASVTDLETTIEETEEIVSSLRRDNQAIRELFKRFVADATATTSAMRAELEEVRNSAAARDGELRDRGMKVLAEMENLGFMVETSTTTTKTTKKTGKKTKKRATEERTLMEA